MPSHWRSAFRSAQIYTAEYQLRLVYEVENWCIMERWKSNRRSLVLDTRTSQYIGNGLSKIFCTGPTPVSAESSPWKLSDSFQCPSTPDPNSPRSQLFGSPGSPRPPRVTPRRRSRSSSGVRQRPFSFNGPLLDESYSDTKSFIQTRYSYFNPKCWGIFQWHIDQTIQARQ